MAPLACKRNGLWPFRPEEKNNTGSDFGLGRARRHDTPRGQGCNATKSVEGEREGGAWPPSLANGIGSDLFGLIKTDPGRLGPAWFALYRFGLLWIALACLGSLWLALACFGLLWSALACFGLLWCALACLELFGPTPRKKARFGGSPGDLNEQAEVRKQTLPKTLKSSRQLPKST